MDVLAKETIPCHHLANGVPWQAAIEVVYQGKLAARVTHNPTDFSEKEGIVTTLELQKPALTDLRIIYKGALGDNDITEYIKNPSQIPAPKAVTRWGHQFQRAIESPVVRKALLDYRILALSIFDRDNKDGLVFKHSVAGVQVQPSDYQGITDSSKVSWSVFLPEAAIYRGMIEEKGSVSGALPTIPISGGKLISNAEIEFNEGSLISIEYDVNQSSLSKGGGYFLGALGMFVASFPAWLPIIRRTTIGNT